MTARTELLERAPYAVLPGRGENVLCAVSGGVDSMCLLHMLDAWCKERNGRVIAAHFNHRLRGEAADRDEAGRSFRITVFRKERWMRFRLWHGHK